MDKGFQKSWLLILITMLLMIAFSFIGLIPFFEIHSYAAMSIGEMMIFIPVIIGVFMLRRVKDAGESLDKLFSPALIPALILLPFCMQAFFSYLTIPLQAFLTEMFGESDQYVSGAASAGELIWQIAAVCALPAVAEEFLCRGVIMRMLKPYGIVMSMTVSAVAFTILHFDITSFPIIFMLGMMMSAVKILTGSIWACILVHFSNNLSAVIMGAVYSSVPQILLVVINILSFALFPAVVLYIMKKTRPDSVRFKDTKIKKAGFSIEMCICLVIFVGIAVLPAVLF